MDLNKPTRRENIMTLLSLKSSLINVMSIFKNNKNKFLLTGCIALMSLGSLAPLATRWLTSAEDDFIKFFNEIKSKNSPVNLFIHLLATPTYILITILGIRYMLMPGLFFSFVLFIFYQQLLPNLACSLDKKVKIPSYNTNTLFVYLILLIIFWGLNLLGGLTIIGLIITFPITLLIMYDYMDFEQ